MAQKTHPIGFRLGITETWRSQWYADKNYKEYILSDCAIREFLNERLSRAGLARVEIARSFNDVKISLHVARPGVVIGRGGSGIELLREELTALLDGMKPELEVIEVKAQELSAELVAQNIVYQLERRRPFRRVMKFSAEKVMTAGADGVKIRCKGLVGGKYARSEFITDGTIPLQSLRANIDYAQATANTQKGTIGVTVWIYKKSKTE